MVPSPDEPAEPEADPEEDPEEPDESAAAEVLGFDSAAGVFSPLDGWSLFAVLLDEEPEPRLSVL